MSVVTVLLFFAGLALLVHGAELLVRGASRLAAAAGVSPLVIGLTVVAFGTSAPELAVSLEAALRGNADVALGNALGSNIFNVLFILGASACITPLVVAEKLVRRDVPLLIAVSAAVLGMALDGAIGRVEGGLLCTGIVVYTAWTIRASRRESAEVRLEYAEALGPAPARPRPWRHVLLVAAGLAELVLGSRWLVGGAVECARWLGVSEVVVGLTIVAAGTSLPEVATSILAAIRGERDIAVGNVVGSNLFNLMGVLGLAAAAAPAGIPVAPALVSFDLPIVLAVAFACLPIFAAGHRIPRWQGVFFVGCYAAYTTYLVLDATGHRAAEGYAAVMLRFVLPLGGSALAVIAIGVAREKRSAARRAAADRPADRPDDGGRERGG